MLRSMTTLALAAALTACSVLPSATAAAAPAQATARASITTLAGDGTQEIPVRYEITIDTTGLSDYELTRDEILVARRAQQRGLTVVDWHTGHGVIIETTSHALLADLLADPHVTGLRKVS